MKRLLVLVAIVATIAALATAALAGDRREDALPPPGCSGAEIMVIQALRPDVPEATAQLINDVISAAQACDYDRLAALALAGDRGFTVSFGGGQDDAASLATYWRGQEDAGEPITATLVQLLLLPAAEQSLDDGTTLYLLPRTATEEDWTALEEIFGPATVATWRTGEGYLGYRAGFSADAEWLFFVAGD